jgi:protease II
METKLTLSLDSEIIKKAKQYAKQRHTSLSNIVENYFYYLTIEENREKKPSINVTPLTNQLKGSIKTNINPEKLKEHYLFEKYLHE